MAQTDPYRSYNFKLEIDGISEGHFTECSGLNVRIESTASRQSGNQQVVHQAPGSMDTMAVTLKYGVTKSRELQDWMVKAAEGNVERRDVSILLLDSRGDSELMRWNLKGAWPSEWQGAALNTSDKGVVIEMLTLVFDRLERA